MIQPLQTSRFSLLEAPGQGPHSVTVHLVSLMCLFIFYPSFLTAASREGTERQEQVEKEKEAVISRGETCYPWDWLPRETGYIHGLIE